MLYHYTSKSNFYSYIYSTDLIRAKTLLDLLNSDNPDNRDLSYPINFLFKQLQLMDKTNVSNFDMFIDWCKTYNLSKNIFKKIKDKLMSLSVLCVTKNPNSNHNMKNLVSEKEGVIIELDEKKIKESFLLFKPKIYDVEYLEYDKDFHYFTEDFPVNRIISIYNDVCNNIKYGDDNNTVVFDMEEDLILLLTYLVSLAKPSDKSEEEEVRIIIDLGKIRDTTTEAFNGFNKNELGRFHEKSFYLSKADKRRFDLINNYGFENAIKSTLFTNKKFDTRMRQITSLPEFEYDYESMTIEKKMVVYYRYCLKFIIGGKDLKCVYIRLSSIIGTGKFILFENK